MQLFNLQPLLQSSIQLWNKQSIKNLYKNFLFLELKLSLKLISWPKKPPSLILQLLEILATAGDSKFFGPNSNHNYPCGDLLSKGKPCINYSSFVVHMQYEGKPPRIKLSFLLEFLPILSLFNDKDYYF